MRDFKLLLKKAALFLLILFVLLSGMSRMMLAFAAANTDMPRIRNQIYAELAGEKMNTIQVLILGDSETYTSVSPMDLWAGHGISSFVCGQSGQKIQESYYMLKKALKTQTPSLILMETNVLYREESFVSGMQTLLAEMGNYYFPVLRFHDIWKGMIFGETYSHRSYKGFQIRPGVRPYTGGNYMEKTEEKQEISGYNAFFMDKIAELSREKQIPLLLYSAPSPQNYSYKKHNGIQEYAGKRSLEYLDLNLRLKELDMDWKQDTLDAGDHLNLSGARKVTKWLGDYIARRYQLKDHRENSSYREWNRQAEQFQQENKKTLP